MDINSVQKIVGLTMLQFEAVCHDKLIKALLKVYNTEKAGPKYGCENGLTPFISLGYQLDASVFLYESVKHLACFVFPENHM